VGSCDAVIVGGGIAGSSLGMALAADGLSVVVLEATTEFADRVRGESMLAWGVREARELGAEQVLLDAGAHTTAIWHSFDPALSLAESEAAPIPVGMMLPGIGGSLNLRHPVACQALADAAAKAGCDVRRGVRDVEVEPGPRPVVRWHDGDGPAEVTARLVVGADGRNSSVRRQAGLVATRTVETHMVAGLLLDGVDVGSEVPPDYIAGEGTLFQATFFQSGGQVRVYLCPGLSEKHRFSGPGGIDEFRRASLFSCVPHSEALAAATPAGPLATYPGDHLTVDPPCTSGVVLIGDAAGYSSPITGQGLSCAMRDARTVRDVLRGGDWSPAAFAPYAEERRERMRRLLVTSALIAAVFADDGPLDERPARRARLRTLMGTDPLLFGLVVSMHAGPEAAPAEALDGRFTALVRG
jgi:2-polyprenyl-6-methoxyphenol hydroxylase-like FAD-dependent oxidoreductase